MGNIKKVLSKTLAKMDEAVAGFVEADTQLSSWYGWANEGTGTTELLDRLNDLMRRVEFLMVDYEELNDKLSELADDVGQLEEEEAE